QIAPSGTLSALYNTLTNATLTYNLTAASHDFAGITAFSITSGVVTFTANNDFTSGTLVLISGLSAAGAALNGQTLAVTSSTGTTFTANFSTPDTSSNTENGRADALTTTYAGTFTPTVPANSVITISGFTNAGNNSPNNSPFTVVSCTSTTLVVNNPNGA